MTVETVRDMPGAEIKPAFKPRLALFHCRWCVPDRESVERLTRDIPVDELLVVSINCTARMEAEFAVKALTEGFDGVLVLGCEIGECHYRTGNHQALKRLTLLKEMFAITGIYPERVGLLLSSPYDEQSMRADIVAFVETLKEMGPFKLK